MLLLSFMIEEVTEPFPTPQLLLLSLLLLLLLLLLSSNF